MRKQIFLLFVSGIITLFCIAATSIDSSQFLIGINKNGGPYANANFNVEIRENSELITRTILVTDERGRLHVSVSPGNWYINVACKTFIYEKKLNFDTFVSTREYSKFCNHMPLIESPGTVKLKIGYSDEITKSISIQEQK